MYWFNDKIVTGSQNKKRKCKLQSEPYKLLVYKLQSNTSKMKSKTNYALKQSIIHASNCKKKLLEVLKGIKRIKPFILLSPPPPPTPKVGEDLRSPKTQ